MFPCHLASLAIGLPSSHLLWGHSCLWGLGVMCCICWMHVGHHLGSNRRFRHHGAWPKAFEHSPASDQNTCLVVADGQVASGGEQLLFLWITHDPPEWGRTGMLPLPGASGPGTCIVYTESSITTLP